MAQKEIQRLEFKVQSSENQQKIGANKMINPLALIADSNALLNPKNEQRHEFEGTFVDDYLLAEDGPEKGKRITKLDKKAYYKTRMCPHGRDCKKRLTCTFAHTEHELRKPFMKRKTMCKLYQMGKCHLGAACKEYHGNIDLMKKNYKYKAQICKDFLEGKCGKGNVCIFIHEIVKKDQIQMEQQHLPIDKANFDKKQAISVEDSKEMIQSKNLENKIEKSKKQIIEVVEQKLGEQKFVEDGLSFNFTFN